LLTLVAKGVFHICRNFRPQELGNTAVETKELTLHNVNITKPVCTTFRWPAHYDGARIRACRQPILWQGLLVGTAAYILIIIVVAWVHLVTLIVTDRQTIYEAKIV
jgi:hypothetical protein